jgi:hypothetical protein
MSEKQTAVEWLEDKLPTIFKEITINKQLLEKAKEMEKQQIIDAYAIGKYLNEDDRKFGEQYYKETFNK